MHNISIEEKEDSNSVNLKVLNLPSWEEIVVDEEFESSGSNKVEMIDEEKNHNFRVGDHAKALLTINIEDNPTENDAEDKLTSKLADLQWNGKEDKEEVENDEMSETDEDDPSKTEDFQSTDRTKLLSSEFLDKNNSEEQNQQSQENYEVESIANSIEVFKNV